MLIQRTRGVTATEGSLPQRARNGTRLVATLLAWTLEDALQTADSMQARGYGTGARSSYLDFRFRLRDGLTSAALLICAGGLIAAWLAGYGFLVIYPRMGPVTLSWGDGWALAGYMVYMLLPLGWEWRDRRAWRILNYRK